MKKTFFLLAGLGAACLSTHALAQHNTPPESRNDRNQQQSHHETAQHANPQPQQHGSAATTVAQARRLKDGARVTLRGEIRQHLRGETYVFRDSSGQINVEIDHDDGPHVAPGDRVEIRGEVDKERRSVSIDADSVRKL